MKESLKKFITDNSDDIFFTGGINEERICKIETQLDVKLPNEYVEFLNNYGLILGLGVEIFGWGKNDVASVVEQTERFRRYGLQKRFIVIRNCDEWIHCLEWQEDDPQISRIVSWDRETKVPLKVADTFDEYLYNVLQEERALWDEDE